MESKLFLKKCGRYRISKLSYFDLTWDQWAKFTKMASGLDYGCNFDADGEICSGNRWCTTPGEMCCCSGCRSYAGYLRLIPDGRQIIEEIASLFDNNHGFWRRKKGCILPAKYRSSTCIAHRCAKAKVHRDSMSNSMSTDYAHWQDSLDQMILYFLDTAAGRKLNVTQERTIIKELIKNRCYHERDN